MIISDKIALIFLRYLINILPKGDYQTELIMLNIHINLGSSFYDILDTALQ